MKTFLDGNAQKAAQMSSLLSNELNTFMVDATGEYIKS